ncbi:extracellular solute-binding protein [Erysipelothrix anatis]|uniref:extracellular solute-binding protein n=1 Tax=Erysipelothrix anatis TaxID=2683713 RepID=UPI00135AC68B|nr:extracellular solute-binding protein [Erysipelothrix anatis]
MKRFVKVMTVLMVSLALAGCSSGKPASETINLKVWGSQDSQEFLSKRIEKFKELNTDKTYNIELGVVGEPDARDYVTQDIEAAADVFAFANDQITDLVEAGALYEITKDKERIVKDNVPGSVDAATIDGKLYAYPMTADNGYFMYYDKSVFTEEDVKSLDSMVKVAEEKNKKIFMDVSNGWYNASFFLGAGGKLAVENGKQVTDFNNARGLQVGEYMRSFTASPAFLTGDDTVLQAGMGDTIAAGVSGTWVAESMEKTLGDNYAATKLPTFNIGGEDVQMASFGGYKLMGVKTKTEHPIEAMALADFLTNEESQLERFNTLKLGPSNIKAAESEAVQANVALSALAEQAQFAHSQKSVLSNYWTPSEAFGLALEDKNPAPMQELLDQMVKQIQEGVIE